MEEYWFLAPMPRRAFSSASFSSASLNIFSETFHDNLPVARAKQLSRSMKKPTSCKKATELPGKTSAQIGQKNIFLPNQRDGIRQLLELVR